jgi:hypothetical protein
MASPGEIDHRHGLYVAWENCKAFMDGSDGSPEDTAYDICLLDWFASRLDVYSKKNILANDGTVSAILYEWKSRMPFDPTKLA